MIKKFILTLLLVGLIGMLIWGGVNRTLAKGIENEGHGTETPRNGNQGWYADRDLEVGEENGHRGGQNLNQSDSSGQDSDHGNGKGSLGRNNTNSISFDDSETDAIYSALDAEYHALAVYQSAVDTFGSIEPFVEIATSEERHISSLINQLNKNNLTIPENSWIDQIPPFESLEEACQIGAQTEIDNAALYEKLLSMTDEDSLIRVFSNLLNASQNSHLPELEDCQ